MFRFHPVLVEVIHRKASLISQSISDTFKPTGVGGGGRGKEQNNEWKRVCLAVPNNLVPVMY